MSIAKVTRNGRITVPADVRKAVRIGAGDKVEFVRLEPGKYLIVAKNRPVTELKGMFGQVSKVVPIEEMRFGAHNRHA